MVAVYLRLVKLEILLGRPRMLPPIPNLVSRNSRCIACDSSTSPRVALTRS